MARYRGTVDTPMPIQEAFAYLSDFSTTAEWDPGIDDAGRLTPGRIGVGSRFRVVAKMGARRIPLEYQIKAFQAPILVVLEAENDTMRSLDTITFEQMTEGTRIVYDADVRLKGLRALADPLLRIAFKRIGDRAVAGLAEKVRGEKVKV